MGLAHIWRLSKHCIALVHSEMENRYKSALETAKSFRLLPKGLIREGGVNPLYRHGNQGSEVK